MHLFVTMTCLIKNQKKAVDSAAASVEASAAIKIRGGIPAAEYSKEIIVIPEGVII